MDKRNSIPTADVLHKIFTYKNGFLYWKEKTAICVKIGDLAGCDKGNGYITIPIKGKYVYAHRIIYMMHHGYVPHTVDHIDGNRKNNKIENLRAATRGENARNTCKQKNNTSGEKNVFWHKSSKKWKVALSINNKLKHIGTFVNFEEAKQSAHEARLKYHKEFANHQ